MQHCFLFTLAAILLLTGCETPDVTTESMPIITVETTPPQDLERMALADFRDGNYNKTVEQAQEIIKQNPKSLEALMLMGDASFMMGNMPQSIDSFDRAIELEPRLKPQLWQRGLALYYADRFKDGQEQFESHQSYNSQDVENAVWHLLCASQVSGLEKAREQFIPITQDKRVPMNEIHQLFGGVGNVEAVFAAAETTPALGRNKAVQMYYAHLYAGLYYDMIGNRQKSIAEMKEAAKINPLRKDLLMGRVADVHLILRQTEQTDDK